MEADLKAVQNSALWAAYSDGLGFITELVDSKGLKRRIKASRVTATVAWRRRVGGRFGAEVDLPAGCYSDDTQLRLATSRAIRGDGEFDVEAFAKVELPVWLCYALGAGRGSKVAAAALGRQDVNWFSNFFDQPRSRYLDGGGNGAAMRIQPHVWAATDRSTPETFIRDVVRNSLCTHGHSRGILGAVFHALCLAAAFEKRTVPGPDDWMEAVDFFPMVATVIQQDADLRTFWLPVWEERAKVDIETAFHRVKEECLADINTVQRYISDESEYSYHRLVEALGGLIDSSRGSGTKTAIIAAALSWMYRNGGPANAIEIAANLLSSDTDTIATMAGALLGAVADEPPKPVVLDWKYINAEATRLHRVSCGHPTESFSYPDLLGWEPPRTQLDAVGRVNHGIGVAGLALAEPDGQEYQSRGKGGEVWQWLKLDFGQSILAKRREHQKSLPAGNLPVKPLPPKLEAPPVQAVGIRSKSPQQPTLFERDSKPLNSKEKSATRKKTLHELTASVIKSDFDTSLIGSHLLNFARHLDGIEQAIAYTSIIIKAKMSRLQAKKKKRNEEE